MFGGVRLALDVGLTLPFLYTRKAHNGEKTYLEGASFVLLEKSFEVGSGDVARSAGELVPARSDDEHNSNSGFNLTQSAAAAQQGEMQRSQVLEHRLLENDKVDGGGLVGGDSEVVQDTLKTYGHDDGGGEGS
jgi:hypothetical protein